MSHSNKYVSNLQPESPQRRRLLKTVGGIFTTPILASSSVAANQVSDNPYQFDVGQLPASVGYLQDPQGRQREAWDTARHIHELEQSASDELEPYSTEDIAAFMETASVTRSDLRSFSRLVEVLHERDLAGIIDVSLLNSIGRRADIIVRFAPLVGGVNNVLRRAEAFAKAINDPAQFGEGLTKEQRTKYLKYVLSIACLCLEAGLMWVGVPYKLAWRGTNRIFFARSGTLFRLARYGGNRFVAFFMSEVHWEIREALFDDVITTEKAVWVTNHVNNSREKPEFTELREDAESLINDRPEFNLSDYEGYNFPQEEASDAVDSGSDWLGEVVDQIPDINISDNSTEDSLILSSTMNWEEQDNEQEDGMIPGFEF